MRGRVAAILLLSLFLALPAFPQCNLSPVFSAQFRSSILDIAIDGNDLYAATGYGVALYDRSVDPPRLVTSIAVPGVTRVVRFTNATLYAGSGSSVVLIRKNGNALEIKNTFDAGGTVNDLVVTPLYAFAATSSGLQQIDLLNGNKTLIPTSGTNVTSIALLFSTLYAADGDSSVERFSISGIVQNIGPLTGVPSSQIVRVNNNRIYISDRLQSTVLYTEGGTKLATLTTAFTAMAPLSGDAVYTGTNDTRVHAIDFTTAASPIEIFEQSIPTTGGSINRISAIQRSGNRLYAAGGDLGLLTFDVTSFAAPFPIHSYNDGPTTSVAALGNSMFVTRSGSGIYEYKIGSSGALTEARHWDSRTHTLRDASSNGFLLSTTGTTAVVWTINSTTPAAIATIDFNVPIDGAVMIGSNVYVLGATKLFTADFGAATPTVTSVPLGGMKPAYMARAGNSIALAEENDDHTKTSVRLLTGTTLSDASIVDGTPTAGIAASGNLVAVFTYFGTLLDYSSSPATQSAFANSTGEPALALSFSGSTLLEMTDTSLLVWNTATRTLARRFIVPAPPVAIHGGTDSQPAIAAIATSEGEASIVINSTTPMPSLYATPSGNSYYKKVAVGGKRMLLFDGRAADIFDLTAAPRWIGSIRSGGLLDVAASDGALYSLSSAGTVTAYSPAGVQLAQTTISEGGDSSPLSIVTVAGVPWVSISKGCLTGGCTKKTFVLDPKTLATTSTMTGGVSDVSVSGTTAYALTDMPGEIRVIDVANAALPNVLRFRAIEGARMPTAIAQSAGTIYVLGDRVYSYSAASLTGSSQPLPFTNDPSATLRVAGNCGVMGGRTFGPLLYALPAFASQTAPAVPAAALSIATKDATAFIVTDDSLEIWSSSALPSPARRRATR